MSPEYNFHLKISAQDPYEASKLRDFILRIRGVEEITPLDQFKVSGGAGKEGILTLVDLTLPIGEVIKRWREVRGLRPVDVVRQAGSPLSKGYYSELEHGKIKNPGDTYLGLIATTLGISKEDLRLHKLPPDKSDSE